MKPGDYMGFTPDTTDDDAAVATFRAKHPDVAEIEIRRDDASVQVRAKQEATDGGQIRLSDHDDAPSAGDSSGLRAAGSAGIGEVTG